MTVTDQAARIAPYLERLLEDDYIQSEIGQALTALRQSSRRAKGHSAGEALKDQRLRRQLRDAVAALTNAGQAIAEPPPPSPARRGLFAVVVVAAAAGGAALAWKKTRTDSGVTEPSLTGQATAHRAR